MHPFVFVQCIDDVFDCLHSPIDAKWRSFGMANEMICTLHYAICLVQMNQIGNFDVGRLIENVYFVGYLSLI